LHALAKLSQQPPTMRSMLRDATAALDQVNESPAGSDRCMIPICQRLLSEHDAKLLALLARQLWMWARMAREGDNSLLTSAFEPLTVR
jgi:hypothetical protein